MNSKAKYQQIFPKEAELKKWIKLYYIHRSDEPEFYEKLTYYPNYTTTLNVYQHSKITKTDFSRTHTNDLEESFQTLLVGKFDRSREIIMNGPINKLTIVFHPLGLNHFLEKPLSHFIESNFSFFNAFGKQFKQLIPHIFSTDTLEEKRDLLDAFFMKNRKRFNEERLTKAIDLILNQEFNSVRQISDSIGISRKTLLRLFQKHLAYAPKEFISIVRFRKALVNYQSKLDKPNFSSLAYESSYYDQADFNHQFKEKTGLNPNQLFSKLKTVEKELYWAVDPVPKIQDKD